MCIKELIRDMGLACTRILGIIYAVRLRYICDEPTTLVVCDRSVDRCLVTHGPINTPAQQSLCPISVIFIHFNRIILE